jgi:hypothetical protein
LTLLGPFFSRFSRDLDPLPAAAPGFIVNFNQHIKLMQRALLARQIWNHLTLLKPFFSRLTRTLFFSSRSSKLLVDAAGELQESNAAAAAAAAAAHGQGVKQGTDRI